MHIILSLSLSLSLSFSLSLSLCDNTQKYFRAMQYKQQRNHEIPGYSLSSLYKTGYGHTRGQGCKLCTYSLDPAEEHRCENWTGKWNGSYAGTVYFYHMLKFMIQTVGQFVKWSENERKMSKQLPPAPTWSAVDPSPTIIKVCRTPWLWKFTQHYRTIRPPSPIPRILKKLRTVFGVSSWSVRTEQTVVKSVRRYPTIKRYLKIYPWDWKNYWAFKKSQLSISWSQSLSQTTDISK